MIYPSADKIDKQVESKYALVILAAKRAKQLKEGSKSLIKTDSTNPLTVALEEIANGSIIHQFDETSLAGREAIADQEAVVGKRKIEIEGVLPLPLPSDILARAASELGADLKDTLGDEEEGDDELMSGDEIEEEEDESPMSYNEDEEGLEV